MARDYYLVHHGIKGQKWGVRRFQNEDGSYTSQGQAENNGHGRYSTAKSVKEAVKNKWNGLSDKQKKYIKIGLAVAATGLAVYGGYKLSKSGALKDFTKSGKSITNDILGLDLDKNFVLTESNVSRCASGINESGSQTNCGSVASAVLLNTLGGDYKALEEVPESMRTPGGRGYDPAKLINCFKDGEWSDRITSFANSRRQASQQLEKELLSQGNGAKGIFYLERMVGNRPGHYFMYAIIDNKVHVLEGQPKGAQSTGIDFHTDFFNEIGKLMDLQDGNYGAFFARLDNCPVKEEYLDMLAKKR